MELIHQTNTAENSLKPPQLERDPRNQTVEKCIHFFLAVFLHY